MDKENEIPRRNRLDLNIKAEKTIYDAMLEIEKLPADPKLTEAITLLTKAKDLVSDFVDFKLKIVDLELAKILKNEGYSIPCEYYYQDKDLPYSSRGLKKMKNGGKQNHNFCSADFIYSAPPLNDALSWLHGKAIEYATSFLYDMKNDFDRDEIVQIYKKQYDKYWECSYGKFLDHWSKYGWEIVKNKI